MIQSGNKVKSLGLTGSIPILESAEYAKPGVWEELARGIFVEMFAILKCFKKQVQQIITT